jgi:hypothetical protein
MEILRSIRRRSGCARWTGRTLMLAALHHGCVSRRLSHSAATTAFGDGRGINIGELLGRGTSDGAVLACQWPIGRRAPTRPPRCPEPRRLVVPGFDTDYRGRRPELRELAAVNSVPSPAIWPCMDAYFGKRARVARFVLTILPSLLPLMSKVFLFLFIYSTS